MRADSFKFTYSTATPFAYGNCVIFVTIENTARSPQGHGLGALRINPGKWRNCCDVTQLNAEFIGVIAAERQT